MADEEKKIIVDEDWKREAQQEKERLAAQEAEEKAKAAAEGRKRDRELPRGDLAGLVNMLTTQALFALGLIQIKGEEDRGPDLELARYNIDILEAIEQKTKGNLTPEEQELLKNTLNDLRMGYVNITNQPGSQQ